MSDTFGYDPDGAPDVLPDLVYVCRSCGGLVREPGEAGRSWCACCEDYELPQLVQS